MARKQGRPKKPVPMDTVDAACQLNATANQVRQILASQGFIISHDTLVREIERIHKMSFAEYRDQKVDLTRLKLVQKAVKMALDGNVVMLIFCLKNMCNWRDKVEGNLNFTANAQPQVVVTIPATEEPKTVDVLPELKTAALPEVQ